LTTTGVSSHVDQSHRVTKTPIAGGEPNSTWRDFKAMPEMGSLDMYQPDAVMAGGTYAGGISVVYWLIHEIQRRNEENKFEEEKS